jgi:TrmH family RNA methyltransferase
LRRWNAASRLLTGLSSSRDGDPWPVVELKLLLAPSDADRLSVVLVQPRNPLNIGAAARAMSNFGIGHLRVVNPYAVAFRQARSAVGAAEVMSNAQEYSAVPEAVADRELVVGTTAVRHRELQHPLRWLDEDGGLVIREQLQSQRVALLFGSEKFGLSNEDLSYCHWLLRIPTCDEHISMNLGQSVAVCLYEIVRGSGAEPTVQEVKRATAGEVDRITATLLEALYASGFVKPNTEAGTEEKIRRLIRRLNVQASDTEMVLGMLRQILWKVKSGK